jgi:dipeptidyl aminopeptidase/acylaminoacyl peptidase
MLATSVLAVAAAIAPVVTPFSIRGKTLELHLYGTRGGPPVVLASGDGGWVHLAPECAEILAAQGYFVVGLDSKEYLSAFTSHAGSLRPEDVPRDWKALVDFAAQGAPSKPVLSGVSDGAGLAVLAATDAAVKAAVLGVVGLGLPDRNELAWHFRDSIIYLTHKAPDEPSFSARAIVDRLAPLPFAELHSTHDEYAPLEEARGVFARAGAPKRMWVVDAENHRFSGGDEDFKRRLLEAMAWVAGAARGA